MSYNKYTMVIKEEKKNEESRRSIRGNCLPHRIVLFHSDADTLTGLEGERFDLLIL